jgi:hypothetical protein
LLTAIGSMAAVGASAVIVQPYESSNWQYSTDGGATWTAGQAGFGTGWYYGGVNTYWASGTTILVETPIDLTGYKPDTASYTLGIDNDLVLYVNGTYIRSLVHDGTAHRDDFIGPLTGAHSGLNLIELSITDRGGPCYFDMQIYADPAPVPEPSTCLAGLGAVGMLGLLGWRSRR